MAWGRTRLSRQGMNFLRGARSNECRCRAILVCCWDRVMRCDTNVQEVRDHGELLA